MPRLPAPSNRTICFNRGKQTAIGQSITTATEFGTNGLRWPTTGISIPNIEHTRMAAHEAAGGHGNEFPADHDEPRLASSIKMSFDMEPDVAATFIHLALGSVSTAGTGVDYANRYIHTVKFQTALAQAVTALLYNDGSGQELWQDLAVERLKFSGSGATNPIKMEVDLYGTGKKATDSTTLPAVVHNKVCRMSRFEFKFAAAGTAEGSMTDYAERVESWDLEIQIPKGETHRPGNAATQAAAKLGNTAEHNAQRRVKLNFTMSKTSSTTLRALFQGDPRTAANVLGFFINCYAEDHVGTTETDSRLIKFNIPQGVVLNPQSVDAGGNAGWTVAVEAARMPLLAGYTAGDNGPLLVTVDNGTDSTVYFQDMA